MADEKTMSIEDEQAAQEALGVLSSEKGNEFEVRALSDEEAAELIPAELRDSEVDELDGGVVPWEDCVTFQKVGDRTYVGRANVEDNNRNQIGILLSGIPNVGLIYQQHSRDPIYEYSIAVHGGGPKGYSPSWRILEFTDESGDTYSLGLYKSSPSWHYVWYNSEKPAIVKITWREANWYVG